jgi:diaminobutyrate-2-oxoglutarate transaminase
VLNYGHNHPELKKALLEHLTGDHVVHGLDMATVAKRRFMERFEEVILKPRGLDYKLQFPGPTGTNAVEAALKLVRKVKKRHNVVCFTNAFHGMTLGALSATGNAKKRAGAGVPLHYTTAMPYDDWFRDGKNTLDYLERYLTNAGSGVDKPAAVILETVQAEGGVNPCSFEWLKGLRELTKRHDILLVTDDIQVGCGRTGPFFSFEPAGIEPDIVCLSKSLSAYGLPLALVLLKPELDVWAPGEHNGTFRGHQPAFVTATRALEVFWKDDALSKDVTRKGSIVRERFMQIAKKYPALHAEVRGRGMIAGIECAGDVAGRVSRAAFDRGVVMETAGIRGQVLKFLAPLIIPEPQLEEGLDVVDQAFAATL